MPTSLPRNFLFISRNQNRLKRRCCCYWRTQKSRIGSHFKRTRGCNV